MITISEWLPNPKGPDSGEWIEIFNPGPRTDLSGWALLVSGKRYPLSGNIKEGEYKILTRASFGFQLKNTDGEISLVSKEGKTVETSSFLGSAPEGKSLVSFDGGYYFSNPSFGLPNPKPYLNLIEKEYATGIPLNSSDTNLAFWSGLFGTVVTLCLIIILALKQNDEISELFFGKN